MREIRSRGVRGSGFGGMTVRGQGPWRVTLAYLKRQAINAKKREIDGYKTA